MNTCINSFRCFYKASLGHRRLTTTQVGDTDVLLPTWILDIKFIYFNLYTFLFYTTWQCKTLAWRFSFSVRIFKNTWKTFDGEKILSYLTFLTFKTVTLWVKDWHDHPEFNLQFGQILWPMTCVTRPELCGVLHWLTSWQNFWI